MKLCVISDVHSNEPALTAVLDDANDTDRTVHAGDVVGYGPHPSATIEKFESNGIDSIQGNHDNAVACGDTTAGSDTMRSSTEWTAGEVTDGERRYLSRLPTDMTIETGRATILVTHGSYRDPDEYVYPTDLTLDLFDDLDDGVDVLIGGHTHYPLVTQVKAVTYLNPGSVGLPRDGDPRASYAVYDTETGSIELRRVEYDRDEVVDTIESTGIPDSVTRKLTVNVPEEPE